MDAFAHMHYIPKYHGPNGYVFMFVCHFYTIDHFCTNINLFGLS